MEWPAIELLCLSLFFYLCGQSSGSQFTLYHSTNVDFEEAKHQCRSVNRILAKVDTSHKVKKIKNLKPYMNGHFWIGLKGNGAAAQNFSWMDSTDLKYSTWATGFPGYAEGLDCVRMRSDNYNWETFNCSERLNFLCEDQYFKKSQTVSVTTKVKGIFMGIGVIGGLLTLVCLLLQLPCCRHNVTDKIAHIGFGTKDIDKRAIIN